MRLFYFVEVLRFTFTGFLVLLYSNAKLKGYVQNTFSFIIPRISIFKM
jgi:hypothetical protein